MPSFLAVLELIKMKKIRVEYGDEKNFANPKIVPNDTGEEMDFTNIAD